MKLTRGWLLVLACAAVALALAMLTGPASGSQPLCTAFLPC